MKLTKREDGRVEVIMRPDEFEAIAHACGDLGSRVAVLRYEPGYSAWAEPNRASRRTLVRFAKLADKLGFSDWCDHYDDLEKRPFPKGDRRA